jgi:hypothetical protein
VQVAIEQSAPGRAEARVHCRWLGSANGGFRPQSCNKPIWLKALGTKHWRLKFKALQPGRYFVLVEAVGRHGLSADTFTKGTGDVGILTVR